MPNYRQWQPWAMHPSPKWEYKPSRLDKPPQPCYDSSMLLATEIRDFLTQSNLIEGIEREPTHLEIEATSRFLALDYLTVQDVCNLVKVYQPSRPVGELRLRPNQNVQVGKYVAPAGGPHMTVRLASLLADVNSNAASPYDLHLQYEQLHPMTDGNGRSGRAIWLWQMIKRVHLNPLSLPLGFLHKFYYDTLSANQ